MVGFSEGGGEGASSGEEMVLEFGFSSVSPGELGGYLSIGGDSGSVVDISCCGTSSTTALGASIGPNHPSCNPLTYSFHVCLPNTKSPLTPSHSDIPITPLNALTDSSFSNFSSSSPSSIVATSPSRLLILLIFSANPALTSPSFLPSMTSQSMAPATRIGFTYS